MDPIFCLALKKITGTTYFNKNLHLKFSCLQQSQNKCTCIKVIIEHNDQNEVTIMFCILIFKQWHLPIGLMTAVWRAVSLAAVIVMSSTFLLLVAFLCQIYCVLQLKMQNKNFMQRLIPS